MEVTGNKLLMASRRSFARPPGKRKYKKLFVLSMEGKITERQYFDLFKASNAIIHLEILPGSLKSSPFHVLKRMKSYLIQNRLMKIDEAWLVIDKDQWTEEQLASLYDWSKTSENYGLALSNPNFEFWLLLHFEDGAGISGSLSCVRRLKRFLPDFDKSIDKIRFNKDCIKNAISRAKEKDRPATEDWPRTTGTTVYRLVEKILENEK
ncbi:MAG: RloB family protein [Candidatus Riflebacteria bacterium]